MASGIIVLLSFIALTLLAAGRESARSDAGFFLADRKLGALALFLTMSATNFSAFTVLGFAGAGYRIGYSFYTVMGLGTAFMALGLYLVGEPMATLGRARGWITPVEFVAERYGSPLAAKGYAVALVAFTLPYLALQPMAAGLLLEAAFGLPYRTGVLAVAGLVGLYTFFGGMRAVARTDAFHGFLLLALAAAAWLLAVRKLGGFAEAHGAVAAAAPALLGRPGGAGGLSPAATVGYFVLWFLADPLFPQLSQRCLAARDVGAIRKTVVAYPLVTTVLFFLTVSAGTLGAALFPELGHGGSDKVWPLAARVLGGELGGQVLAAVLILAPLAAILTTMDSQLLTLASIAVRDIAGDRSGRRGGSRIAVVLLSCAGAAAALSPPRDILDFLNRSSFLGFAALSPLAFGGLYCARAGAASALAALAAGQAATFALGLKLISLPGVPDIFVVAGAAWGAFFLGAFLDRKRAAPGTPTFGLSAVVPPRWLAVFALIVLPAFDFWNWGKESGLLFGLPAWTWINIAQGVALSAAFALFFRRRGSPTLTG